MATGPTNGDEGQRSGWVRILLLLPFLGVLWVPFYNRIEPTWLEIPFFYWYQMLWIVLCAVIVSIVYLAER